MRLIKCSTLKLEEFFNISIDEPQYAILSHTWDAGEVSFQDFVGQPQKRTEMRGWEKIMQACKQATEDGIEYVWVDTCCIDKTSSSELTEAINSMYNWYLSAAVCYAYLQDLNASDLDALQRQEELSQCRWFTRGWTLQELIAPNKIKFYSKDWNLYGTKEGLHKILSNITGIDEDILEHGSSYISLRRKPVCRKMFWAAKRKTKREEDVAYCLMGIFEVNMPLLYGEGRERAFIRLQEEILKDSNDLTLFAWKRSHDEDDDSYGIMAHSPKEFRRAGNIELSQDLSFNPKFEVTNKGVQIHTRLRSDTEGRAKHGYRHSFMSLECHHSSDPTRKIGIELEQAGFLEDHFNRTDKGPTTMKHYGGYLSKASTIYIAKNEPFQVTKYWPGDKGQAPLSSPSLVIFEDEFRMGRGETSKWYTGPESNTFITFQNEFSEPAERWSQSGLQTSGAFQTTDTPRFIGLRKFHGVCEFEPFEFVVVCGFSGASEAWLCLATPKSHSKIWEAVEHLDLERVGEIACKVSATSVNLEKDPEHNNLGESLKSVGPRFKITASSNTKKEEGDLELHIQLRLQMGYS